MEEMAFDRDPAGSLDFQEDQSSLAVEGHKEGNLDLGQSLLEEGEVHILYQIVQAGSSLQRGVDGDSLAGRRDHRAVDLEVEDRVARRSKLSMMVSKAQ